MWVQWFIHKAHIHELFNARYFDGSQTKDSRFLDLHGLGLKQCDEVKLADAAEYEQILTEASDYETLRRLKEHLSSKS